LPANGAVPGATMIFNGGTGIGDFWQFPNASELTQDTDQDGKVRVHIQGRHQKHDRSFHAAEWNRPAEMHISATVEAVNERSIASTFWDSLVAPFGGIP